LFIEADVRLMSLRAFIVGAAATLLASNSNILTHELIKNEINALPQKWLIPIVSIIISFSIIHLHVEII